jgi:hypothetical protein
MLPVKVNSEAGQSHLPVVMPQELLTDPLAFGQVNSE